MSRVSWLPPPSAPPSIPSSGAAAAVASLQCPCSWSSKEQVPKSITAEEQRNRETEEGHKHTHNIEITGWLGVGTGALVESCGSSHWHGGGGTELTQSTVQAHPGVTPRGWFVTNAQRLADLCPEASGSGRRGQDIPARAHFSPPGPSLSGTDLRETHSSAAVRLYPLKPVVPREWGSFRSHVCGTDREGDTEERQDRQETVPMRGREQVPGPQSPSDLHGPAHLLPGAPSRKAGALDPHSPRRLLQNPHRLPEPGWAPSWGQVGAYCPCWARPGSDGLAGHLLRGSGQDGSAWRRAQGSVLGVPSGALWLGRRQRPNCRSQLPAPTRRPPPSRPASFLSHPPPAARFYGNRAMLRTDVLLGWTAGDVLFLHHTAVTRAQARLS